MPCEYRPVGRRLRPEQPPAALPRAVTLAAPGDPNPAVVQVTVDGTAVTLLHPYEGLNPQPGWVVSARNLSLTVVSVSGRTLTCE